MAKITGDKIGMFLMAFYTQVSTCIYKLEQDKLHTCDAVTPLHSFVLVVSGGLLSDEISHHCIIGNHYAPSHNICILSFAVNPRLRISEGDCTQSVCVCVCVCVSASFLSSH